MKTNQRIAIASACGATIGYGLGTTFMSGVWLIVATLIGGVCGWIAFSPITLISTFFSVLKEKISNKRSHIRELWDEPWKSILPRALKRSLAPFVCCQAIGAIFWYCLIIIVFIRSILPESPINIVRNASIGGLFLYLLITVFGILFSFFDLYTVVKNKDSRRALALNYRLLKDWAAPDLKDQVKILLITNPISLPFTATWKLVVTAISVLKFIWKLLHQIPTAIQIIWFVIAKTCLLAHNNGRLSSLIGASMGTTIGVVAGHVVIGMMSGTIIGLVVNFIGSCFSEVYVKMLSKKLSSKLAWM